MQGQECDDMLIDKSQDLVYVKLDSIDTPKGVLTAWQSVQLHSMMVWSAVFRF